MADKKETTTTAKTSTDDTHRIELPVLAFVPAGYQPIKATATAEKVTFEDASGNKETVDVADFELPEGAVVRGGRFRRGRAARLILEVAGTTANMGANVSVDRFSAIRVAYHELPS